MSVRNRNKEIRKVRVGDLWDNPANHRVHPDGQKAAMAGILNEVGYVGTLLAFEMDGGQLRLCDGHLRKELIDPDEEIDVCVVDLEPEERRKVLATHDAIGAMAEIDHQALDALVAQANVEDPALKAMLADLSERSALSEEESDEPQPEDGDWPEVKETTVHNFLIRCNDDELAIVREFIGRRDLPDTRIGAAILEQIKALIAN